MAMPQRTTELRHLTTEQKHKISIFLEEGDSWKRLMSIVPKSFDADYCSKNGEVDWQKISDNVGKKYTNEQINLISNPRQGDSRLPAEIFLDEWSTSGPKDTRPTVGVLLSLLTKAELFGAADYVAERLLNEPPPQRPEDGPGARIDIELPSDILNGVSPFLDDSTFYPNTEDININANSSNGIPEINQDYYTKYRQNDKMYEKNEPPPKPAPRTYRKSERIQRQEPSSTTESSTETITQFPATATTTINSNSTIAQEIEPTQRNALEETKNDTSHSVNSLIHFSDSNTANVLPLLSMLSNNEVEKNSEASNTNEISGGPLPLLSAFQNVVQDSTTSTMSDRLPAISALNLDGQEQHNDDEQVNENSFNKTQYDMEDDADDDNSLKNLGSSNNDSSLTNVTGTSGDNSFELSSSSTSNENIPLNVLNFSR